MKLASQYDDHLVREVVVSARRAVVRRVLSLDPAAAFDEVVGGLPDSRRGCDDGVVTETGDDDKVLAGVGLDRHRPPGSLIPEQGQITARVTWQPPVQRDVRPRRFLGVDHTELRANTPLGRHSSDVAAESVNDIRHANRPDHGVRRPRSTQPYRRRVTRRAVRRAVRRAILRDLNMTASKTVRQLPAVAGACISMS